MSVKESTEHRRRPHGLNTVEMLKVASSALNMGPHHTMQVGSSSSYCSLFGYNRLQSGCIRKATLAIQERNPVAIHPTMTSVLSCGRIRVMPFGADMHKICCNRGFRYLREARTLEIIHRSVQSSVPDKRIWMAIPGDSMITSLVISWPLCHPMPSISAPTSQSRAAARDSRRRAFSYREKDSQPSCHGRSPSPSNHSLPRYLRDTEDGRRSYASLSEG